MFFPAKLLSLLLITILAQVPAHVAHGSESVTVYVDRKSGVDSYPGTSDRPVKSISRGVQLAVQANALGNPSRVQVAAGMYRESVTIGAGGTAAAMTIDASPGAVLSGADVWRGWKRQPDGSFARRWPFKWGVKAIPEGWEGYWNWDGNGAKRNALRRSETVWINGRPLRMVLKRSRLAAGTFFVDQSTERIFLRPSLGVSMASARVAVGVRQTVLGILGRQNLTVRGLTIERSRGAVQETAVPIAHSTNVTLDGVTVRQHAYTGLGTASNTGLRIHNSRFVNNGVAGYMSYRDSNVVLADSLIARNNWRGRQASHTGWDSVFKWGGMRNGAIRRTQFLDNHGSGLWLDWDNQNVVVAGVVSAGNLSHGAYLEANTGPITIRNSTFCNNGQSGVADARSNQVSLLDSRVFANKRYQLLFTGNENGVPVSDWQTGSVVTALSRGWTMAGNKVRGGGKEGWLVWIPNDKIFPHVRNTLQSNNNTWYHAGRPTAFQLPVTEGGSVNHPSYRRSMIGNEADSVWRTLSMRCPH